MSTCNEPYCSGTIEETGFCDTCGRAPLPVPESDPAAQEPRLTSRNQLAEQVKSWLEAARTGDSDAIGLLGTYLYYAREARETLEELCCQAADAGDLDRMNYVRGELLRGLRDLPHSGISSARSRAEEERWYQRAASAGSVHAMIHLAKFLDDLGRLEESERWLRTATAARSSDAMVRLATLQERQGRLDEAEQLLRRAIDAGSLDAMVQLAKLVGSQGRLDEEEQWLRRGFDEGASEAEWIMKRLADLCMNDGRQSQAEHWLRTAVETGSSGVVVRLAALLERQGRLDEAEQWLRSAGSSVDAMRSLARLLASRGREAEAKEWYQKAEEKEQFVASLPRPAGPTDWDTIVTTAIVTSAVVPFVQTIVTKAAEDSYAAARTLIRRLLRQHGKKARQVRRGSGSHVVVQDPDLRIALEIRPDVSDDALRALARTDLEQMASRCAEGGRVHISFNPTTGAWEVLP